jgi:hypothetical protein
MYVYNRSLNFSTIMIATLSQMRVVDVGRRSVAEGSKVIIGACRTSIISNHLLERVVKND